MITLAELIDATTWLKPQDHIKITLWNKDKAYTDKEFEDLDVDVKNVAKYADYYVSDIDIEFVDEYNTYLTCMIRQ